MFGMSITNLSIQCSTYMALRLPGVLYDFSMKKAKICNRHAQNNCVCFGILTKKF